MNDESSASEFGESDQSSILFRRLRAQVPWMYNPSPTLVIRWSSPWRGRGGDRDDRLCPAAGATKQPPPRQPRLSGMDACVDTVTPATGSFQFGALVSQALQALKQDEAK